MFKIFKTKNKDYPFNVQRWTKSRGCFYYSGVGIYCRNLTEVKAYCRSFWKNKGV